MYFKEKFDSFLPDFIRAQCELYNCKWKDSQPCINCYVGYIPFYPRSAADKWFYVSYQDEERVFSGAVHEINHMIFFEKWKELVGEPDLKEPGFPLPLWYLMEMIVDPTLNDPAVRKHTLYDNRAYVEFYKAAMGEKSPMERLKTLYENRTSIEDFIIRGYDLSEEYAKNKG